MGCQHLDYDVICSLRYIWFLLLVQFVLVILLCQSTRFEVPRVLPKQKRITGLNIVLPIDRSKRFHTADILNISERVWRDVCVCDMKLIQTML